jgi:hypothetical protein
VVAVQALAIVVEPLVMDVDMFAVVLDPLAVDEEPQASVDVDLVRSPLASAVRITPAAAAFDRSRPGACQRLRGPGLRTSFDGEIITF